MKKASVALVVLLVAVGGWFLTQGRSPEDISKPSSKDTPEGVPVNKITTQVQNQNSPRMIPGADGTISDDGITFIDEEGLENIRPAATVYASADQALQAVLKGARDFDDSILEQFTEPGNDCTWCPEFYSLVQENLLNPSTPQDQKSYLAEVLAISGRTDNVQILVDSIKNAASSTDADIYAEALELSLGDDSITRVLGEQLVTTNDTLREASVAAITNQGTLLAAELLQKHVEQRNDPDAYYSVGIGPGEFIPESSALPFVQEQVAKRDQYSPMWAKALINTGVEGVRMLFDQLELSNSPASDSALLKDAIDHVNFEDGIKELTDHVISSSQNSAAIDFAKQIQSELMAAEIDDVDGMTVP
jgi:hypothetical protein